MTQENIHATAYQKKDGDKSQIHHYLCVKLVSNLQQSETMNDNQLQKVIFA